MIKNASFKKLEEVLKTVRDPIKIELSSSCSSDMPAWADVNCGYIIYRIQLMDMDERYWEDGIYYFFNIIKNSNVKYICNEYIQYSCKYKIWTLK